MDEQPEPEQIKISIFTPLIYVGILLSSFIAFSIIYRRNRLKKLTKVEPIFAENHALSLYQFLKDQYNNTELSSDVKPHSKVLKAALLRRGVEAIRRSLKLKENEPIFNRLYQEGLIGDEVFKNFEFQAKFQELELKEIVQECEGFKKGWSQQFFTVAQEICFNEALRRRLGALDARGEVFADLWEYHAEESEKPVADKTTTQKIESKPKITKDKPTEESATPEIPAVNSPTNETEKIEANVPSEANPKSTEGKAQKSLKKRGKNKKK